MPIVMAIRNPPVLFFAKPDISCGQSVRKIMSSDQRPESVLVVGESVGCGRAVRVLHVAQDDGIGVDPIGWV